IAVDSAGNVYVTGSTDSTNFPTASPFQAARGGHGVAFVTKISDSAAALSITSLSPASMPPGTPGFVLTVNGSNFVAGSEVLWNGSARTTTFAGSVRLTASIPASDIAAPGTASVTVSNPGGVISNASSFEVMFTPTIRLTLNVGGTSTTSTGGTAANVRTGYATATVDT